MAPSARVALGLCVGFLVVQSGVCRTVCGPSGVGGWNPTYLPSTLSPDGRTLATPSFTLGAGPYEYRTGQCVWQVDSMKNGTYDGVSCHTIGRFTASSADGSSFVLAPQRGISCLVKTGDYIGPEPTRSAKCVTKDDTKTSLSADGKVISSLLQNEESNRNSIMYIKEQDIVPLSRNGWQYATPPSAANVIPAGARMSSRYTTRWMSDAGLIAFTLTLEEGNIFRRAVHIVDTSTGSYHNLSMDWVNPTYWGYAAPKQEQYLFYFESQPGAVRNLCATTRAVAKVCKEIHIKKNMKGLVLLGGYTSRNDSQPVALLSYQDGPSSVALCKTELSGAEGPGDLICLTGVEQDLSQYMIIIPDSDTGVWMLLSGRDNSLVELTNLKDGPIEMQKTKQILNDIEGNFILALSTASFTVAYSDSNTDRTCVSTF